MYSRGGKAFIVLHSTTSKARSRIRVRLTEGSVVTTLKNTVDHVTGSTPTTIGFFMAAS